MWFHTKVDNDNLRRKFSREMSEIVGKFCKLSKNGVKCHSQQRDCKISVSRRKSEIADVALEIFNVASEIVDVASEVVNVASENVGNMSTSSQS